MPNQQHCCSTDPKTSPGSREASNVLAYLSSFINHTAPFHPPRKLKGCPTWQNVHIHCCHLALKKKKEKIWTQKASAAGRTVLRPILHIRTRDKWRPRSKAAKKQNAKKGFFTSLEETQESKHWKASEALFLLVSLISPIFNSTNTVLLLTCLF